MDDSGSAAGAGTGADPKRAACSGAGCRQAGEALVTPLFEPDRPLIRASIIYSGHLNLEQQAEARDAGDADVCRDLLGLPEFHDNLSDGQAEDIMALGDRRMLQKVARRIHLRYLRPEQPENRRLSQKCGTRCYPAFPGMKTLK